MQTVSSCEESVDAASVHSRSQLVQSQFPQRVSSKWEFSRNRLSDATSGHDKQTPSNKRSRSKLRWASSAQEPDQRRRPRDMKKPRPPVLPRRTGCHWVNRPPSGSRRHPPTAPTCPDLSLCPPVQPCFVLFYSTSFFWLLVHVHLCFFFLIWLDLVWLGMTRLTLVWLVLV